MDNTVTTKPESTRYHLFLRALPDKTDPAGVQRLRSALKCLLRSFRLRCESAIEVSPQGKLGGDSLEDTRQSAKYLR